eukprot:gnl/Hemi2/24920_TR8385_c0_g1_i1.p1 gnl/Hemi2/24920_TR8385_c0_g1~~gnl/Hemi2/24920_TR8385_c0_g1_i1.p1  ORF type:complete len:348 (-),score=135.65 gnl/Hemi2/24920_TR8385_c0_g1_i1:112-1155(-)
MDMHKDPQTLSRQILEDQMAHPHAAGNLTMLLSSIQLACKVIGSAVRKIGIFQLYGSAGGQANTSGDEQKKLDVLSNEVFINTLRFSNQVCVMASEEDAEPIYVDARYQGKYIVTFDPLDGSSNIDVNVSVGTIFGIYMCSRADTQAMSQAELKQELLQPGTQMVAAGYALYGSSLMMVISTGPQQPVRAYTFDPSIGEFILSQSNLRIPARGPIYSINEGNASAWDAATTEYVRLCKFPEPGGKKKSLRYIGSMVADIHRSLIYGGVFMYPGDKTSPNGKLRLLYECNPIAFLIENAGGRATTGTQRILEIRPTDIHMRVPCIMGSAEDVQEVERLYAKHAGNSSQ